MTNTVKSWIEERRSTHEKAVDVSESEWFACRYQIVAGSDMGDPDEIVGTLNAKDYTTAIVDAHNMFPRAMDAIERVLELHAKSQWGFCTQCMETGEYGWMLAVQWPCATVQAIGGAIND